MKYAYKYKFKRKQKNSMIATGIETQNFRACFLTTFMLKNTNVTYQPFLVLSSVFAHFHIHSFR